MNNFILSSGTVLPIVSDPIYESSVAISDGVIIDIGPTSRILKKYADFSHANLGEGVLLPGFINGHVHLELGWIKDKIGSFGSFTEWLSQIIKNKAESAVTEQLIKATVEEGLRELKESGVTTVGEISSYGGVDVDTIKESGLRSIIFEELFDKDMEQLDQKKFIHEDLLETRPFPHAPYSCSYELLKSITELSQRDNVPLAIHLAESPDEVSFINKKQNNIEEKIYPILLKQPFERPYASSPLEYLGTLDPDFRCRMTLIHAVHVSEEEVNTIIERDLGVITCPRSNILLKVGIPPLAKLTGTKRLGLATDGLSSNSNLNYFDEMNTLDSLLKESIKDRSAFQTIYCATLGGAGSLFIEERVGSIERDKDADLIFISSESRQADPYGYIIVSGNENLEMSMVKGKVIWSKDDRLCHLND